MTEEPNSSTEKHSRPLTSVRSPGPQLAKTGRPLDSDLTGRLLTAAADLLAEGGWSALSADRLAERTRSGKGGTYRRWPNTTALAVEVTANLRVLDPLPDEGSLTGDLIAFHQPLTRPLTRDARTLVSVIAVVHQHAELATALQTALWDPLADNVRTLTARHAHGGADIAPDELGQHLVLLSTSLWARHLMLATPLTADELNALLSGDHLG